MKQTSVEWLIDKFDTILPLDFNWDKLEKVFEQAKAMDKQQMADKWQEGYDACEFHNDYENLQTKPINNPYK